MSDQAEARATERSELIAANRGILTAMVAVVGPAVLGNYLLQLRDRPVWQFEALTGATGGLWAAWLLGWALNRRGRLEASALLMAYSLLAFDALALALRQGIFAGVMLTNLGVLIYCSIFVPRRMLGATGFILLTNLPLRVLDALGRLPSAPPTPLLAVAFDLTIVVCALAVTVYFLRQRQRISEIPYAALQETAARQRRLLDAVSALQPQVEELVRQGTQTARVLAAQAAEQAATADEVSRAMEQVQAALVEAAAASRETRAAAGLASEEMRRGSGKVGATADELARFRGLLDSVRGSMEQLSAQSERTEEVIGLLQEVNEQLNMLAINAALEAARAGDAGRGFGVVAQELRAMLSANGTRFARGKELLGAIRVEATRTLELAQGSVNQLAGHLAALAEAGAAIAQLDARFAETTSKVEAVAEASERNQAQVQRVADAMRELRASSGELTGSASGLSEAMGKLTHGQQELSALVEGRAGEKPAA